MSKKGKQILGILVFAVLLVLTTGIVSFAKAADKFVPGTYVNGVNVGGLTVEEAKIRIWESYTNTYKLTIVRNDGTEEYITGADIGHSVTVPDVLQLILDQQNENERNFGPGVDNSHEITVSAAYDEAALVDRINGLSSVSGERVVKTQNARITEYKEGQAFSIIRESEGNSLNVTKTIAVIKEAAATGKTVINLKDYGCYEEVTVRAADESLVNLCDSMNRAKDMAITYQLRGKSEVLSGERICTWMMGVADGQIQVDRDKVATYIGELAGKYDTANVARTLKSASGREVSVNGTYGWKINQAAETDALITIIRTGQTQSREPEYSQRAVGAAGNDWGNTYVEIDLTSQHVYMTKNGKVVWDAPCVTGNVSKSYTTPAGIFSLNYKERNRVLRGKKQADGSYEYESPVDYWMPFDGGIGLHDANWRSKFGGSIYQKSGSRGCINLPPVKAKALYDLVYPGIPVICYN